MNAGEWIALGSLGLSAEGAMLWGAAKLSRMAAAVERLEGAMSKVAEKVDEHEGRLNRGGL